MRWTRSILITLLVSVALPGEEPAMTKHGIRSWESTSVMLTNADIVVSPGNVVEGGSMLVVDGRVEAVGQSLRAPEGVSTHDMGGLTIYPGFIDPYTEYGLGDVGPLNPRGQKDPRYETDRPGLASWNEAIHADRRWVDQFKPDRDAAEKLMARGFTVVGSAKKDGIFRGRSFVASLADGTMDDIVIDPASVHWVSFDKGTSNQEYPSSLMGSIALIRQTLMDAAWAKRTGRTGDVSTPVQAIASYDGAYVFETGDELTLLRAARIADELGLRLILVGSNHEFQRLDAVRQLDTPLILPLSFEEAPSVGTIEDELDVTLAELRLWERSPSNPAVLASARVPFAFTSHGLRKDEDFLANLRTAIARGLTADEALAALTTIPARLIGQSSALGTLERGKRANFLVVDGDLFAEDSKAKIESVWIDGRMAREFVDDDQLDFRGTYQVEIEGRNYTLSLTGEKAKLKGELSEGETTVELKDVKAALDSLSFQVPMEEFDAEGVSRFSIRAIRDEIVGQVTLPGGMPVAVMIGRKPAPEEEPEGEVAAADTTAGDEEKETVRDEPVISRLTYPNLGFGYETIPTREDVLVTNATVWTMEADGVVEDADVLIRNGKIAAVGRDLSAPSGVRVIDATGKHVTPGMIDEHSHLAISRGVNEGSHAVTAEVRIGDVVDSDDVGVYRALAGGTTAAQLLHGSANPIGGQAQIIKFRWGHLPEDLKLAGAPPSIKFALGENVKQSNWGEDHRIRYPQTRMGVDTIMKDRFLQAREYAEGWKRWNDASRRDRQGMTEPRRDLQLETLAEILAGERFIHSHSYVQSEILALMRLAEELGFRVQTFTHILEGYKVAPEMAAHGAGGSTFSDWWAYKFEVYDAIPYNPCLMHEAGVLTSINSDSSELIRRLNQEAAKSVMYCGMGEVDALAMATINPAKQLKIDDRVGSLRVGKDADFVIWSDHPLSMYAKAEQTWVDGTPYFTLEKDLELREKLRVEKDALVQKLLRSGEGKSSAKEKKGNDEMVWDCEVAVDVWAIDGGAR